MLRRLFKFLFTVCLFGGFIALLGFAALWITSPAIERAEDIQRRPTITLLDDRGDAITQMGDLYGRPVDVNELPKHLIQAILATEDRRYYSHFGIDPRGLARAMVTNVRRGKFVQGGSTITQQTAKLLFLTPDRTLKRKVREAVTALKLERRFTKDQIFKVYLNRVYLGAGTYGFEAAAQRYFGKSATQVDLFEAAVLAGLLKAPSRYNPQSSFTRARDRATVVLRSMVAAGYIDELIAARALEVANVARYGQASRPDPNAAFVSWILRELNAAVGSPKTDIVVHTTMDPELQRDAQQAVTRLIAEKGARSNADEAAFVGMDGNGAVRALVGGITPKRGSFDRASQAKRQPGSVFKLFVYLAALEAGFGPESLVRDAPVTVEGWSPKNYDGRAYGDVSLREAFRRSLNLAAVQTSEYLGRDKIIALARRLGIESDLKDHPSLPLGASEVSLLEMVGAYTAVANGGTGVFSFGIKQVSDARTQQVLYQLNTPQLGALDARVAQQMRDMLAQTVATGTAQRAAVQGVLGGKTGTSSGPRDAWFLGFSQDLVAGVWVGNDKGETMRNITGGGLPVDIWLNAVKPARSVERKRADILQRGIY